MSLSQELSNLVHSQIAVIMNDGNGYRGKLVRYDDEIIILEDIYETSTTDIDWIESQQPQDGRTIRGYVPWRRITLPRVILRIQMILRIWPWQPPGEGAGKVATREKRIKR